MTFGYAAFTLMNSSPFDPEWPEAVAMAVKLLEKEQEKLDNAGFIFLRRHIWKEEKYLHGVLRV